jgi:hypothetical protein
VRMRDGKKLIHEGIKVEFVRITFPLSSFSPDAGQAHAALSFYP